MITMEHVCKSYKIAKRNAGFGEALKALFHREYEVIRALDNVTFTIGDGEMVGYIGPNGAGKSSTIKILSGILTPESGSCLVDGRIPWKHRKEHVRRIGVVFGQRSQLWWDVPVIDSFELLKDIYSISPQKYRNNMEELTQLLHLQELLKMPTRQLSLGQRMRCEIAASLLHSPRILFLDEPTIGLDAVSKLAVREFILRLNQTHKTTVILTTHDMQDIEALTRRIILIGKGRVLMDGTLEDMCRLAAEHGTTTVRQPGQIETGRTTVEKTDSTDAGKQRQTDLKGLAGEKVFVDGEPGQSDESLERIVAALYQKLDIV